MKRITLIILVILIMIFSCACNLKENNSKTDDINIKIALVCDFKDANENGIGNEIYNSIVEYYSSNTNYAKKYHPQSDNQLHIIQTIESAITDGYNVISVIGNSYGNAVSSIASQYPHIKFVIFGMSDAIALHTNVYCCNLDSDYLSFYNSILK